MQTENTVTVASNISPMCFIRFGFFDSYRRRQKWKKPLIVSGVFLALAALAFVCTGRLRGAETWMKIALVLAAAIPVMDLAGFFAGLLNQISKHELSRNKTSYYVVLGPEGIGAVRGAEHSSCGWEHVFRIYRDKGCVYLYVAEDRAFLLPDSENTEKAWQMIRERTDPEKITDLTARSGGK